LKEAPEVIKESLAKNSGLIKFKGINGGKMAFYNTDDAKILNGRWVLASFDDGHIDGEAILEYKIGSDKRIEWKLVAAFLNE
jgi:hypothetical protein